MPNNVLKRSEIDAMEGLSKTHFLNPNAQRTNKSLGDLTGLTGLGVHIIEVPPGKGSTEYHVHHFEDECTYVLSGSGVVLIGAEEHEVEAGDFVAYPAGGEAHTMHNRGDQTLRCIVVGQRLAHDVSDYPRLGKRLDRNSTMPWDLVDIESVAHPNAGKK